MRYQAELDFIVQNMKTAFHLFSGEKMNVDQKSAHDLVTNIDKSIEEYLSGAIKATFKEDRILGEEWSSDTEISGRTWTIDPIDGTCNMASEIGLYGVQCSLIEDGQTVLAAIYVPAFDYLITAVKGNGCYFNNERISVKKDTDINNAIISFGDYPHKNSNRIARWQHNAIKNIFDTVAKIRMFGSACIDFSFVAAGKTSGTVVITKNLWDINPGILVCREAGATVVDLYGNKHTSASDGVIVGANKEIADMLVAAFAHNKHVNPHNAEKAYDAVIFDFDGVILDTEKYHLLSWNQSFEKYGAPFSPTEYEPLKSTGRGNIINYFEKKNALSLTDAQRSEISAKKGEIYARFCEDLGKKDLIAGVADYLDFLNANYVKIAVASSSTVAKQQLDQLGLTNRFDVIVDGNEVKERKPDPTMFLKTAELLGVAPENCLIFEDSFPGVAAAQAGGFEVIYVGENHIDGVKSVRDFTSLV